MEKKIKIIKLILLILILIILFIKIFFLKELSHIQKNDDFLFLRLLSKGISSEYQNNLNNYQTIKNNNKYIKEYRFKINYKNMNFKSIDLVKTINEETLIYEKIAPGTNGSFNIILDSNYDLKYTIGFNSINEKPKNLNFRAIKNEKIIGEADSLEKLSEKLTGYINKNEKINITVNWYWDYESQQDKEETDRQDTKDSENIERYQFKIYTLGEEIF